MSMFVCSLILFPFDHAFASSSTATLEEVAEKRVAIERYLARLNVRSNATPLTPDELGAAIGDGVVWLKQAQEKNGHFRYEYLPYEDHYLDDDNIVRQAGALYALGEVLRRDPKDTHAVADTMERSIRFFISRSKRDTYDDRTFRCVTKTESSMNCPLGATALALIGTLAYIDAFPKEGRAYAPLIADYRAHILAAQKENGGFRNSYKIGSKHQNDAESSFSNGEALYALVRLYEHERSSDVKRAIGRAVAYLEAQPYDSNLYLWIMAALRDLDQISPNEAYATYAKAFTEWRVAGAQRNWKREHNYCPYAEGLSSALALIAKTMPESTRGPLVRELDLRNRAHMMFQITANDRVRLELKEGIFTFASLAQPRNAIGGFLTGEHELSERIDFTQHCIIGYVQTLADLNKRPI